MHIGEAAAAAGVAPETEKPFSLHAAVAALHRTLTETDPASSDPARICSFL